jgi:hypothetical protein
MSSSSRQGKDERTTCAFFSATEVKNVRNSTVSLPHDTTTARLTEPAHAVKRVARESSAPTVQGHFGDGQLAPTLRCGLWRWKLGARCAQQLKLTHNCVGRGHTCIDEVKRERKQCEPETVRARKKSRSSNNPGRDRKHEKRKNFDVGDTVGFHSSKSVSSPRPSRRYELSNEPLSGALVELQHHLFLSYACRRNAALVMKRSVIGSKGSERHKTSNINIK